MAKYSINSTSFYAIESPPKRSRLQDCTTAHRVTCNSPRSSEQTSQEPTKVLPETVSENHNEISKCSGRESPLPLKNLGNTCYENSIIQCLFSLELFMDKFQQSMEKLSGTIEQADFRFRISNAFYNLYRCYTKSLKELDSFEETQRQERQQEVESKLEELKSAVGERSSQFNSTHQQDASEFFYHVIDSIQEFYQSLEETNDYDNPVTETFELELDYMMRCPSCHHKITAESEKVRTLPLALPHVSNENAASAIETATSSNQDDVISRIPTPPNSDLGLDSPESNAPEEPQDGSEGGDNKALTEEPNTTTTSYKSLSSRAATNEDQDVQIITHHTLSDALNNYFKDDILEFKCSQTQCESLKRTKKCMIKKLPQVLFITLARYSYSGKKNLDEIEAPFELSVPFDEYKSPSHSPKIHNSLGDNDSNYQLVAVVCHLGSSLDAGHYTSYVYNQKSRSWFSCDDDSITKVQEREVKTHASKSGYCFFYVHKSTIIAQDREPSEDTSVRADIDSSKLNENEAANVESCAAESSVIMTPESSPSPSAFMSEDTSPVESNEV